MSIYGLYMGHMWTIYGPYMDHTWTIYGQYMDHIWSKHGLYMVHTWTIHGPYMLHIWTIYGPYMDHIWSIYQLNPKSIKKRCKTVPKQSKRWLSQCFLRKSGPQQGCHMVFDLQRPPIKPCNVPGF